MNPVLVISREEMKDMEKTTEYPKFIGSSSKANLTDAQIITQTNLDEMFFDGINKPASVVEFLVKAAGEFYYCYSSPSIDGYTNINDSLT